jgi:hydroxymethylbilane synthase
MRIGTRGSPLALFQADAVAARLMERHSAQPEIVVIRTSGDRLGEAALSPIGGKRLFVREIEDALLAGAIDLAVHSSQDMSAELPDGLRIGAALPREDARDALVVRAGLGEGGAMELDALVAVLGRRPRIGTSSVRRSAQLARIWPEAAFAPVRGNLDTRLRKLDAGEFDALVLAAAGLRRLGRADRITHTLRADVCVPAPGQGIIAVEIRDDDTAMDASIGAIGDDEAAAALVAERAVVTRLGGGCQMPIGAFAHVSSGSLSMHAVVIAPDGDRLARAEGTGSLARPEQLGIEMAERLLAQGADAILADVRRSQAAAAESRP